MRSEMSDFVSAFRVFKGKAAMGPSAVGIAQVQAAEMAAAGKTQQSSADGTTWKDRFKEYYGDYYRATEFVGDSCEDAFSFVVYAIDTTKNNTEATSIIYKYMTMDQDENGEPLDFSVECGFGYNTGNKLITFGVIDIYCL